MKSKQLSAFICVCLTLLSGVLMYYGDVGHGAGYDDAIAVYMYDGVSSPPISDAAARLIINGETDKEFSVFKEDRVVLPPIVREAKDDIETSLDGIE